jgi:hypothetical protein
MNENSLELHELDELKAAYNLMDERLDGQEIVSDEQLREAMMRRFTNLRQNLKQNLIWGDLLFVPVLAWWAWAYGSLSLVGIIILGVYFVASVIFRLVMLRRTKKEDYGSYDLKTLVEKEANYTKNVKWFSIGSIIFIIAFFLLMFAGIGKTEWFIFIILTLIILIPVLIRWLVIKYKYNGRAIDPATGKPRKLGGKWSSIIGYSLFGLSACLFLVAGVMSVIDSVAIGWLALLKGLSYVSFFIAAVVLLLGIFHGKGKINVSYRLLVILTVIAIALAASIAGIVTLNGITELTKVSVQTLMSTVAFSAFGQALYRMRKSTNNK